MKKTYVYKIHWIENGKRKSAHFSSYEDVLSIALNNFCYEQKIAPQHITSARKVATI